MGLGLQVLAGNLCEMLQSPQSDSKRWRHQDSGYGITPIVPTKTCKLLHN